MGLAQYHRKRHFQHTGEPKGKVKSSAKGNLFVVQKHDASRLHYDFRLELDGVLKSWAVPKGPSLDPEVRSLAVEVEDHPVEYGDFEGKIPEGEYGGGTVMLWDRGTWEPVGDPRDGLRRGKLSFTLHGRKLRGAWTLVRMNGDDGDRNNWLLRKKSDAFARPVAEFDVLREKDRSVASRRGMKAIASAPEATWSSKTGQQDVNGKSRKAAGTKAEKAAPRSAKAKTRSITAAASKRKKSPARSRRPRSRAKAKSVDPSVLPGAKRAALPASLSPELATLATTTPRGDDWMHEIKFDGYRILAIVRDRRATLMSRNGKDWTHRFAHVAEAAAALPLETAILDGEITALDVAGRSNFQQLQNAMRLGRADELVYHVFDLPYLDGYSLQRTPLLERKQILAELLAGAGEDGPIRFSAHVVGSGEEVFREACRLGVEGVVSKRRQSPYVPRRTGDWIKTKCGRRQEFVIGGFTDPGGTRVGFGALLLGYYEGDRLVYCGKVGTGFDTAQLRSLHKRLQGIEQDKTPFANPPRGAEARGAHWVKPTVVAEIAFTEFTSDGSLRHPSFQGLREDKPARQVVREEPAATTPPAMASAPSRNGKPPVARQTRGSDLRSRAAKREDATVAGVSLSNPEKVLYPEQGLTKRDLAEYYAAVADRMLPYVRNRPLMLVRCPQGRGHKCFYQKHFSDAIPEGLRGIPIREEDGEGIYIVLDDVTGLVALAQIGVLEIHSWASRADRLEQPDQLIFDLDPGPGVEWPAIVEAARLVRRRLSDLGLKSFLKLSGGKGLHVVAPLTPRAEWDAVKEFARNVAESLVREKPDRYIATMSKARRAGKIFVDYLRNGRGATCVAPYSPRAREGAPVSMPIRWEELEKLSSPKGPSINEVMSSKRKSDPWKGVFATKQALTKALLAEGRSKVEGPRSKVQGRRSKRRRAESTPKA